ncbi:hypothetical protein PM8797T_04960 [Gimesia maris DSM 8797]|nr:hypothetical protein PM8797T_04960 [Gimesia maris DSM 8797]
MSERFKRLFCYPATKQEYSCFTFLVLFPEEKPFNCWIDVYTRSEDLAGVRRATGTFTGFAWEAG